MFRTRLSRVALAALVCLTPGCGLFDRCCGRSDRPGLFSRFRGQSPDGMIIGGDCAPCENGTLTSGPFLGNPPTATIPNNIMLPSPRPAIPQIEEGKSQPMPYDPNKTSRPITKPGNDLKTVREG